jgi:uncharacterized protein (TIGR00725 family)
MRRPAHRARPQVTVIGNSQASAEACDAAERLGHMLGRLGCTVVTGGGGGIMLAVCRGARAEGALTVGVLPGDRLDDGNHELDVVLPSGLGYARNMMNVLAADLVVAVGGQAGTLSEIAYAWMHGKPIFALADQGGWAARLAGERVDERRADAVVRISSVGELEAPLRARLAALGFESR